MSFKGLIINDEYRSLVDDVIDTFYIPCLKESVEYRRSSAYFSSTILLQISKGLSVFTQRKGKIKLLVSPNLSRDDYKAVEEGYSLRKKAEEVMFNNFDENIDFYQKTDRFTMLSYLIANDILEIKVAIPKTENDKALYHEKLGVFVDGLNNHIAFSGSANETGQAFKDNYETIDVFCDWKSENDYLRCYKKYSRFDRMWDNEETNLLVIDFPTIIKNKILKYNDYENVDFPKLDADLEKISLRRQLAEKAPKDLNSGLFQYQNEAIDSWVNSNYKSSLVLATGAGKTFIGFGAIKRLFDIKKRLVVFVCCPYTHLVDQWTEEAENFGIEPIPYYSSTKTYDDLKRKLMKFKTERADFICVITTNGSYMTSKVQDLLEINIENTLLVVDEAHNFGARKISKYMDERIPYRLALSATLERHGDEEGTDSILNYFGPITYTYTLERAIQEGKLTPYRYIPVPVYLDDDEYERYYSITEKINKFKYNKEDGMPDALKALLIKRARILAETKDKLNALKRVIKPYKNQNNLLIYCGAVKYEDDRVDNNDVRQIDEVREILRSEELGIVSMQFTSSENAEERRNIIKAYKDGHVQALVAIKCLDEGVNIPAIKTAFILASSTNPKEYIQRRGRVLRKYPGKDYAEIYDFITLPRRLEDTSFIPDNLKKMEQGLVKREFVRLRDFANLSQNPSDSNTLMDEIINAYDINVIDVDKEIGL